MRRCEAGYDWTATATAKLGQFWAEGHATAEIGRRLGVSKNAVIGKAHRIGLPSRPSPVRCDAPANARTPPTRARALRLPELLEPRVGPRVEPVRFGQAPLVPAGCPVSRARAGDPCRWPVGEPGRVGFRFCDQPSIGGKPYCADHAARAYVRQRPDQDGGALEWNEIRR